MRAACSALLLFTLAACAPPPTSEPAEAPPRPAATTPEPVAPPAAAPDEQSARPFTQRGRISLYGDDFDGRTTASGEPFDPQALTMAHRSLPFGTRVRVTNLENGRSVEVVVNDRGPYAGNRIADLSLAAARRLGMVAHGVVNALLEVVAPAKARQGS